jgi:hypothetical protein
MKRSEDLSDLVSFLLDKAAVRSYLNTRVEALAQGLDLPDLAPAVRDLVFEAFALGVRTQTIAREFPDLVPKTISMTTEQEYDYDEDAGLQACESALAEMNVRHAASAANRAAMIWPVAASWPRALGGAQGGKRSSHPSRDPGLHRVLRLTQLSAPVVHLGLESAAALAADEPLNRAHTVGHHRGYDRCREQVSPTLHIINCFLTRSSEPVGNVRRPPPANSHLDLEDRIEQNGEGTRVQPGQHLCRPIMAEQPVPNRVLHCLTRISSDSQIASQEDLGLSLLRRHGVQPLSYGVRRLCCWLALKHDIEKPPIVRIVRQKARYAQHRIERVLERIDGFLIWFRARGETAESAAYDLCADLGQ